VEAAASLYRVLIILAVHLPESFRGGCSFGAMSGLSRKEDNEDIIRGFLEESIKVIIYNRLIDLFIIGDLMT